MRLGRVGLLGPVTASTADGVAIRLGPPQQVAVFAVLALRANQTVSVDSLVIAIWGESAPAHATATATVQTYISRIRRAVDPAGARWHRAGLLSTTLAGYRLRLAPELLDVNRFDRMVSLARAARATGDLTQAHELLEAALAEWRGVPFGGLAAGHVGLACRRRDAVGGS